jgi:hypothetical protein
VILGAAVSPHQFQFQIHVVGAAAVMEAADPTTATGGGLVTASVSIALGDGEETAAGAESTGDA